jgi:hypothetical protein
MRKPHSKYSQLHSLFDIHTNMAILVIHLLDLLACHLTRRHGVNEREGSLHSASPSRTVHRFVSTNKKLVCCRACCYIYRVLQRRCHLVEQPPFLCAIGHTGARLCCGDTGEEGGGGCQQSKQSNNHGNFQHAAARGSSQNLFKEVLQNERASH